MTGSGEIYDQLTIRNPTNSVDGEETDQWWTARQRRSSLSSTLIFYLISTKTCLAVCLFFTTRNQARYVYKRSQQHWDGPANFSDMRVLKEENGDGFRFLWLSVNSLEEADEQIDHHRLLNMDTSWYSSPSLKTRNLQFLRRTVDWLNNSHRLSFLPFPHEEKPYFELSTIVVGYIPTTL